MSDQNPYKAPVSTDEASPSGAVTVKTRELLGQASPWLRFLVVLGYIGLALGALAAVGAVIFVIFAITTGSQQAQILMTSISFLFFVVIFMVIYYFPLRLLGRMAKGARGYKANGEAKDLELVAGGLKGLAKFYGVFTIVILSIYAVVGIVALIVFATQFKG